MNTLAKLPLIKILNISKHSHNPTADLTDSARPAQKRHFLRDTFKSCRNALFRPLRSHTVPSSRPSIAISTSYSSANSSESYDKTQPAPNIASTRHTSYSSQRTAVNYAGMVYQTERKPMVNALASVYSVGNKVTSTAPALPNAASSLPADRMTVPETLTPSHPSYRKPVPSLFTANYLTDRKIQPTATIYEPPALPTRTPSPVTPPPPRPRTPPHGRGPIPPPRSTRTMTARLLTIDVQKAELDRLNRELLEVELATLRLQRCLLQREIDDV